MKKLFLLTSFFLMSCSDTTLRDNISFQQNMSFEEFKVKLKQYAIDNPYPKIDD